MIVEKLIH